MNPIISGPLCSLAVMLVQASAQEPFAEVPEVAMGRVGFGLRSTVDVVSATETRCRLHVSILYHHITLDMKQLNVSR